MTVYHDYQYHNLVKTTLNGKVKQDRTKTGTHSIFGAQMRFDLSDGSIPLLTTKKMHLPSIIREILWYIQGNTNISYLKQHGIKIWDLWADSNGDIGPLYGKMLRDFDGVDQLAEMIHLLKTNPDSRRMVVSYWSPSILPDSTIPPEDNPKNGKQSLAPCHYTWQLYTTLMPSGRRQLSMQLIQRSCDVFLGVPFNISQYSIMLRMIAHVVDMDPGEFIWIGGDVHIYSNHLTQMNTQLARDPYPSPKLSFARSVVNINDFDYDDFVISGYIHHPLLSGTPSK